MIGKFNNRVFREHQCFQCNAIFITLPSGKLPEPMCCPVCGTEQAFEAAIESTENTETTKLAAARKHQKHLEEEYALLQKNSEAEVFKKEIAVSALKTAHEALYQLARLLPGSTNEFQLATNALAHCSTARANLAGKFSDSTRAMGIDENHLGSAIGHIDPTDALIGNSIVARAIEQKATNELAKRFMVEEKSQSQGISVKPMKTKTSETPKQ